MQTEIRFQELSGIRIEPKGPSAREAFIALIDARDILISFVLRDWKVRYAAARLGWLWAVAQPALAISIIGWVFGRFRTPADSAISSVAFLASGWAIWQYFSSVLIQSSQVYRQNSGLLRKVYFPRVLLPLSKVFGALPELLIGLAVGALLAGIEQGFRIEQFLSIPLAILAALLCTLGPALMVSCAGALWRDLSFGFPALIQLLFFVSPIAFGVKRLEGLPGLNFNPILPALDVQHRIWFGVDHVLGGWEAPIFGVALIAAGAFWSWKLGPKLSERL